MHSNWSRQKFNTQILAWYRLTATRIWALTIFTNVCSINYSVIPDTTLSITYYTRIHTFIWINVKFQQKSHNIWYYNIYYVDLKLKKKRNFSKLVNKTRQLNLQFFIIITNNRNETIIINKPIWPNIKLISHVQSRSIHFSNSLISFSEKASKEVSGLPQCTWDFYYSSCRFVLLVFPRGYLNN